MENINLKKITAKNIVFGDYIEYKFEDYQAKYLQLNDKLNKFNFYNLSKFINKVDSKILPLIRELIDKKVNPVTIHTFYKQALIASSEELDIDSFLLLDILNKSDLILEKFENPDMTIYVDSEIRVIKFSSKCKEFSIDSPRLLWECNKVVKGACNFQLCRIHQNFDNQQEADNFTNIFKGGVIKLVFDNTITFWKQYSDLWPASIDTFNLINDLRKNDYHKRFFKTVLDIGTGTGMLGLWLVNNNDSIKKLILSDWLLLPLVVSSINAKYNKSNCNIYYSIGLNTTLISTEDHSEIVDLAICNPPYLPSLGFENLLKESTVAGTDLLEHVIRNYKSIATETVISFSDLALPEAMEAAKDAGIDLMKMKLPDSHEVPFRVRVAFNEKGYIDKLIAEGRGLIVKKEDESFPYWHKINTYILK